MYEACTRKDYFFGAPASRPYSCHAEFARALIPQSSGRLGSSIRSIGLLSADLRFILGLFDLIKSWLPSATGVARIGSRADVTRLILAPERRIWSKVKCLSADTLKTDL